MPKQKYDWSKLKLEYFQSDIDEIKSFFQAKWKPYVSTIRDNTRGRWKEKQAYKEKVLENALKEQSEKDVKELTIPVTFLMKAKKMWIVKLVEMMWDKANIWELIKWINSIKTELWEPTNISKSDTTVRREPLDEDLFIDN